MKSEHIAELAGPGAVLLSERLADAIASGASSEQHWGPLEVECSEMDGRGWRISQAVGMMRHMDVRDSSMLTEGIDPRSEQIVRHILDLVEGKESERRGEPHVNQDQESPEVLTHIDSEETLAFVTELGEQHTTCRTEASSAVDVVCEADANSSAEPSRNGTEAQVRSKEGRSTPTHKDEIGGAMQRMRVFVQSETDVKELDVSPEDAIIRKVQLTRAVVESLLTSVCSSY